MNKLDNSKNKWQLYDPEKYSHFWIRYENLQILKVMWSQQNIFHFWKPGCFTKSWIPTHSVKIQEWCTIFASQMETGNEQKLINMHIKTEGITDTLLNSVHSSNCSASGSHQLNYPQEEILLRETQNLLHVVTYFLPPLIFSKVNGKKKKKSLVFQEVWQNGSSRKRRQEKPFTLDHPLRAITDNRELPIKTEFQSTTKQTPTEEHTGETWTDKTEDNHMAVLNDPINTRKVWCF